MLLGGGVQTLCLLGYSMTPIKYGYTVIRILNLSEMRVLFTNLASGKRLHNYGKIHHML